MKTKRWLEMILVLALLLFLAPQSAQAAVYGGNCGAEGDNLTWNLDTSTGALIIEGTGAMDDWEGTRDVPWFRYSSDLKSLSLPQGLTTIGKSAFFGCNNLTGLLTIPASVTTIGDWAFFGCNGFTGSLMIGNSVTTIGDSAFSSCSGFTGSLTIGFGVTTIGDSAFSSCSGFTGSLTIPASITTIGDSAFFDCSGFTGSLTIPASVTTIGDEAFFGCNGFTDSLMIGNSVTTIGDSAFSSCSGFTGSLMIGNSVTTIGDSAFYSCSGFTGLLTIPASVTTIGDSAFYDCSGLTGSLTIPASVTTIGESAFLGCDGFTGLLTISNNVTTIGDWAFRGCDGLTGSLIIPASVITIGDEAFSLCSGITSIIVSENNPSYTSEDGILYNKAKTTLIGCPAGKTGTLTIPSSVTTIGDCAFYFCNGLTGSLTIPASVTTISDWAFLDCSGFTGSLTIPASVTTIGNQAFTYCDGFTGTLTIPNSVTSIGRGVFSGTGFTSIIVGDGNANYSSLDGILYNKNRNTLIQCPTGKIGALTIPSSVTTIGDWAFYDCSGLTGSLTIPASVTTIGDLAFSGCDGLTGSLTIPDHVTTIGEDAFLGCDGFTGSLTIPDSVINIGGSAFEYCRGFTGSLTIGNSVTDIGISAFHDCRGFTGPLTIPASVTYIGGSAFSYCNGFTGAYFRGDAPGISYDPFPSNLTLYYISGKSGWTSPTWEGYNTGLWDGESVSSGSGDNGGGSGDSGGGGTSGPVVDPIVYQDPVNTQGSFSIPYSSNAGGTVTADLFYSDDMFDKRSTAYDHALAKISLGMTMASVTAKNMDNQTASTLTRDRNIKQFFSLLEFEHYKAYDYHVSLADTSDKAAFAIASKKIEKNGETEYLLAVAVRSGGYGGEWVSNFNVMEAVTRHHTGFDTAAAGVYTELLDYMQTHGITADKANVWVSGFSRGAAVANLVGSKLNANSSFSRDDVYVYTFATPATVLVNTPNLAAGNIHNICSASDLVPQVPLTAWGYTRYGTTYYLPCGSTTVNYYKLLDRMLPQFSTVVKDAIYKRSYEPYIGQELLVHRLIDRHMVGLVPDLYTYRSDYQDFFMEMMTDAAKDTGLDLDKAISFACAGTPAVERQINYMLDNWDSMSPEMKHLQTLHTIAIISTDTAARTAADAQWSTDYSAPANDLLSMVAGIWRDFAASVFIRNPFSRINYDPAYNLPGYLIDIFTAEDMAASPALMEHWPEVYLAWMNSISASDLSRTLDYKVLKLKCPVDISVYDSNNRLVARIVNDVADDTIVEGLPAYVDVNGEKTVCLPGDGDYRIELTATGDGVMNYSVAEYDAPNGLTRRVNFYDVPLTSGKTFSASSPSVGNASAPTYQLHTGSQIILADEVLTAGALNNVSINVNSTGDGVAFGGGSYTRGETALLSAYAHNGASFTGWYENNALLATGETLSIRVADDRNINAAFTKIPVTPPSNNSGGGGGGGPTATYNISSEAAGNVWTQNSPAGFVFKCNGDFKKFQGVAVNGNTLSDGDYTAAEGSTIITLKPAYLNTLTTGKHTLRVKFKDGYAQTTFAVAAAATETPADWENPFADVSEDDWFYPSVQAVVTAGLFEGTSATAFAPQTPMTRAMFVTVLWRLAGEPGADSRTNFIDVATGAWYAQAVGWAAMNNIVTGTGEATFSPDDVITREQMATILYRYRNGAPGTAASFTDAADISDWATEAVNWCVAQKLFQGYPDGTFKPQNTATRAEVAAVFARIL